MSETPKPKQKMPFSAWLVGGVLIALILAALAQPFAKRGANAPELHGDAEEASLALAALLEKRPAEQRASLLLKLAQEESPGARYAAVDALGDLQGAEVADALEQSYRDSASQVRQRALEVLPKVDAARGLRMLLAGLRDEDAWMRHSAVTQLSTLSGRALKPGDPRPLPMLIEALDDPDPVVSLLATGALRKLTGKTWRVRMDTPPAEKRRVLDQWKQWWAKEQSKTPVPAAFAEVAPIRPTRADPAPDFDFPDLDGRRARLSDQKGKLTLLNFWGSWCPPCQAEIPALIRLDKEYRERGLDIIGIALDEQEGAEGLRRWCGAHGVTYRQALGNKQTTEAFGHIHDVPVSILIDRQGRIRYRWEGDRDFATFRAGVERLLRE